jgi:hypothetical protein
MAALQVACRDDDPGKVYDTLDGFFRSLGLSQEAIDRVNSQPAQTTLLTK